ASEEDAFKKARSIFEKIKALDVPEYALLANAKLAEIQKLERQQNLEKNQGTDPALVRPPPPEPVLEPWVAENTRGILHMPEGSRVIVGDDILSEGDVVGGPYRNHMVYRIDVNSVVFRVDKRKDFTVKLEIK
ncbi:MAG: hypothetical protein V2A74_01385, partial [bacterium]